MIAISRRLAFVGAIAATLKQRIPNLQNGKALSDCTPTRISIFGCDYSNHIYKVTPQQHQVPLTYSSEMFVSLTCPNEPPLTVTAQRGHPPTPAHSYSNHWLVATNLLLLCCYKPFTVCPLPSIHAKTSFGFLLQLAFR